MLSVKPLDTILPLVLRAINVMIHFGLSVRTEQVGRGKGVGGSHRRC